MSDVLLRCDQLAVGYQGQALLPPISVDVCAGEFWVVVGRNGAGKTTWLRTVLGLLPPISGSIAFPDGKPSISYSPQRRTFDELFPVTAREVVRMGIDRGWSFLKPRGRSVEVDEAMKSAGCLELSDHTFRSLSEGQKQRVLLARMVASGARLALLDEPTAAMDSVAERASVRLLDQLRQRYGLAVIVVSHALGSVAEYADHAILLDRTLDSIVIGSPDEVFGHTDFQERYASEELGA